MRLSCFLGRLGVCKLTLLRLRSAGIADRKVPWLSCAGSIILRRARGESRGDRRRGMGAAFFCVMKSSCSRGVEGRLPGLGFNRLPCGNCLCGWYLGPAARGGVSSGRSFHTEGTWCFAGAVKFMSIFPCFIFPYFSSKNLIIFFQIFNYLPSYNIFFLQSK